MARYTITKEVYVGDVEVDVELSDRDIERIIEEHGEKRIDPREEDFRVAVRAIKNGQDLLAITSLQRAFGHDTAMIELIENEWRRK